MKDGKTDADARRNPNASRTSSGQARERSRSHGGSKEGDASASVAADRADGRSGSKGNAIAQELADFAARRETASKGGVSGNNCASEGSNMMRSERT